VSTNNGIGGPYLSNYSYAGAKFDLSGAGFLGFRQMTASDPQTGIVTTTNYQQAFPFTGLVASRTKSIGSQALNQTTNTYACVNLFSGSSSCPGPQSYGNSRYFVSLQQSVEKSWELNGNPLPFVTTTNQYDYYNGNATQVIVETNDGYAKTTSNTYAPPDLTNWFLGRLVLSTVTSTAP
jgi:hypothetical protein